MKKIRFISLLAACVLLCSIGVTHYRKGITTQRDSATKNNKVSAVISEDSVRLCDIDPPVYDEVFAVLQIDADKYELAWGASLHKSIMMDCSSFPGFGRPILVDLKKDVTLTQNSILMLTTSYGNYYYQVTIEKDALLVDGKLMDRNTKSLLFNPNISQENLYIYNECSKKCYVLRLNGGTVITL